MEMVCNLLKQSWVLAHEHKAGCFPALPVPTWLVPAPP